LLTSFKYIVKHLIELKIVRNLTSSQTPSHFSFEPKNNFCSPIAESARNAKNVQYRRNVLAKNFRRYKSAVYRGPILSAQYRRICRYRRKNQRNLTISIFYTSSANMAECVNIAKVSWDLYYKLLCWRHEWRHFHDFISRIDSFQL
jgi:hypothetical protein